MKEVTTDKGVISIPVAPQRVVANYSTDLDYALVLGLPVVGGGPLRGELGYPFAAHQRAYDLKGITPIAIFPQINFESLVSLKPDVIIANYTMEPNGYELLSAIAPTIWLNPDNNGGPAVTAGGLIFIAATTDNLIRAIDIETGETLWSDALPGGGQANPLVVEVDGRQFVIIYPGGHHFMETPISDSIIAYGLPEDG